MTSTPATVEEVIDKTNLRDVRLLAINADVALLTADVEVNFEVGDVNVGRDQDEIFVRFEHKATFTDGDGDHAAQIDLVHIARFTADADLELTEDAVGGWVFGNVYFMVYPYVREALQAICMRLGLPAVVLGYLKRGELTPRSITLVVNSTTYRHAAPADVPLPLDDAQND